MSKFIKLLKTTLEKYGYIPSSDKWEEFNELVTVFEEKENYSEFLEKIESERKDGSSSSLLRLLKWIILQWKITKNNLVSTIIRLIKIEGSNEHFDATLIDIFFELTPTKEEKEEFIIIILSKPDKKYVVYESLLIHATKYYTEDNGLFCDVYLESLNSKRGNYIWVHWFQEAYIRIAKSEDLQRFIETLYTPEYKKAFELFIDGNEETLRLFFENIPPIEENFELFKKILTTNSEWEDPDYILSDYSGYNKKIFLDAVFAFLSKSGKILPFVKDFLGTNYGIFETREYLAHYMTLEEVAELWVILADKLWWIVQLYEYIENQTTRTDKENILSEIKKIPWFYDEMEKTRLSREKYEQEEKERKEKQNASIIADIQLAATIDETETTRISPLLIDLYKKHKELFTKEQVAIVKEHLKRFFAWELFPLEKITFTRTQTAPWSHSYSYSNNIWYREWFFLDALEIASELDVPYPDHNTLVRSLAIIWIGEWAKKHLIPSIGSLTRDDMLVLKSVYAWSRADDLCEFMWGQNFFELYGTFGADWKKEKDILREILYAFIEKHEVDDYIRETALQILTAEPIRIDEIDRPFLESLWKKEIAKYPGNLIETYERQYSYLFTINQVLINLWDEDAILWRFDQLLKAKVDFPDPYENYEDNGYARSISDLEDELSHDKSIIKWLEKIQIQEYQPKILQLYKHWLDLLNQNAKKYSVYWSYLIWFIGEISKEDIGLTKLLEGILLTFTEGSSARRLGWYKLEEIKKKSEVDNQDNWEFDDKLLTQLRDKESEIRKLQEQNQILINEKRWNPSSPFIVFIEWSSGEDHLVRAWEWLNPGIQRKFSIVNGFDANHIYKLLSDWTDRKYICVIWIFDSDFKWLSNWWKLTVTNMPSYVWDIGVSTKIQQHSSIYWVTLPIHRNNWAHVNPKLSLEDIIRRMSQYESKTRKGWLNNLINRLLKSIGRERDWSKVYELQYTAIEEMYYWISWVPQNIYNRYWKFIDNGKENPYSLNKKNLSKNIPIIFTKEFGADLSLLYKNFIPLFDKINEIIAQHEKEKSEKALPETATEKSS